MSTHSKIAVRVGDEFRVIYTHWDGYPDHHLPILQGHYNSQELAERLVEGGSISMLSETIETCIYYERDRGELSMEFALVPLEELDEFCDEDYVYIWTGSEWIWSSDTKKWWKDLKKTIVADNPLA